MLADKIHTPSLLESIPSKVVEIQAGAFHSFAITEQRHVYAWGNNKEGVLGLSPESARSATSPISTSSQGVNSVFPSPTSSTPPDHQIVHEPIRVIGVTADRINTGVRHTIAWDTESGGLYVWGSNQNMQLGLDSQTEVYGVTKSEFFQEAIDVGFRVQSVVCGEAHCLAIVDQEDLQTGTTHRHLFGWGSSKSQQLTLQSNMLIPYPVKCEIEEEVLDVYTRSDYCMALCRAQNDNQTKLLAWGSNMFGRLGIDKGVMVQRLPRQVLIPSRSITKVALGQQHAVAVVDTGQVYSWGFGRQGQLGLGTLSEYKTPRLIQSFCITPETKIKDAACGKQHTLFLATDGRLYSCGSNQHQCLGHIKNLDDKKRALVPAVVDHTTRSKIVKIRCGSQHCLLLTDDGRVYAWGDNSQGQLGIVVQTKTSTVFLELSQKVNIDDNLKIKNDLEDNQEVKVIQSIKDKKTRLLEEWHKEYREFMQEKRRQQQRLLARLAQIVSMSSSEI